MGIAKFDHKPSGRAWIETRGCTIWWREPGYFGARTNAHRVTSLDRYGVYYDDYGTHTIAKPITFGPRKP